jgi:hypothetical protein
MNTHDSDKQIRADLLQIARKVGYANSVEQLVREASTLWSFVEHGPDDGPVKCSYPINEEVDKDSIPTVNIPTVWKFDENTTTLPYTITTTNSEGYTFAPSTAKVELAPEKAPEPEKISPFKENRDVISGLAASVLNTYINMELWNHEDDLVNLVRLAYTKKDASTHDEVIQCSYKEREEAREAVRRLRNSKVEHRCSGVSLKPQKFNSISKSLTSLEKDLEAQPLKSTKQKFNGCYETCTKEEVEKNQFQPVYFNESPIAQIYKKFVLDKEDYVAIKKDQKDVIDQLNDLKKTIERLSVRLV